MTDGISRRRFVAAAGTAGAAGLAGCSSGGAEATPTDYTESETRVAAFLNASVADDTFDGTFVDATGQEELVVDVGADGNGAAYAFAPVAVRVSAGTTVSWQWTGQGGLHNVVSVPDSDAEFDSGNPKQDGDPFEQSLDDTGVALYVCEPHRSLGMKGGITVE